MGLNERTAAWLSAVIYTGVALALALAFALLAARVAPRDAVARYGGGAWVFLLAMIVLMPTFAPVLRRWLTRAHGPAATVSRPQGDPEATSTMNAGRAEMKLWPLGKKMHETQEQKAVDPVCKMQVSPSSAAAKSEYNGKTYYFCATGCKQAFDKEPQKYVMA